MVEIISKDYGVFSETLANWIEKRKLKKATYVVVMNRKAIDFVAKKFDIPEKKIFS